MLGIELTPRGLRRGDRILDVVARIVLELLADLGTARVLLNALGLMLAFVLAAYALRALSHWRRRDA